ncbi:MAG: acetolactate synthase [Clostridia bacterium]|nr:acetolactate synthase [Clostridia bacterium]
MFIKQISVFLENTPGSLREMTELLGRGGVDLLALSLADTQNFGIVRLIVHSEQIDPAVALLKQNGYIAKVNHVICAAVPDRPLGLCELLSIIEQAGLSVEYMYSFLRKAGDGTAHMIPRLNDGARAAQVFGMKNVTMLSQEEVDNL